jgi:hypothetical protein
LNFFLDLILEVIVIFLIFFVVVSPYFLQVATNFALSCMWPFIFN